MDESTRTRRGVQVGVGVLVVVVTGAAVGAMLLWGGGKGVAKVHARSTIAADVASPSASAGASASADPARVEMPLGVAADYQLGGGYTPEAGVGIVERDRRESPVAGAYNVCYVNAFQTQSEDDSWWERDQSDLLLRDKGALVEDPGWKGEYLLDTTTPEKRLRIAKIMGEWFMGCKQAGFQAVEADNLGSYTRSHGLVSAEMDFTLAADLVREAHAAGLAIAQKDEAMMSGEGKQLGFDFAVAEECAVYQECGAYTAAYGERVIEVEYTESGVRAYREACAAAHGRRPIMLRERLLSPPGSPGYTFEHC